jgi:hypothetical protein
MGWLRWWHDAILVPGSADDHELCMRIHWPASSCACVTRYFRLLAVDLGARSGLIGAAEPMSIQAVLAVQIGGSAIALDDLLRQAA